MAKLDKQKRLEFLRKFKALLEEYDASIEVVDSGVEYEGHLTIYANDVHEVAEFGYNLDITVEAIENEIGKIEREK